MNRKMTQMLQPSFQLYFACLILFAAASAFFSLYLAAAEAVVVVLLGLYYRENSRRRRREIAKYIENVTGNMDVATKDTMVNSPLPMVIFRPESDDIIWTNDRFLHLAGEKEHLFDAKLSSVIPDFDTRWSPPLSGVRTPGPGLGPGGGLPGHHLLGGRDRVLPSAGPVPGEPPGDGGAAAGQL